MDILAALIRITLLSALCISTASAFQTCPYTAYCEGIVPDKGANIGHDEEEYCQILQETVCCFDYNKIRCQPETLVQIDRYLNSLFTSNLPQYCRKECNDGSILGYSLLLTVIGFIFTRVFNVF